MWIERIKTGWVLGDFVEDRKITIHITRNPLKDIFLYIDEKYLGLLNEGRFYFPKGSLDKIVYTPQGKIELHLKGVDWIE